MAFFSFALSCPVLPSAIGLDDSLRTEDSVVASVVTVVVVVVVAIVVVVTIAAEIIKFSYYSIHLGFLFKIVLISKITIYRTKYFFKRNLLNSLYLQRQTYYSKCIQIKGQVLFYLFGRQVHS